MLGIFLSAICALNINASAMTASVDTLDRYIINNQAVGRFDGSQLVGKTISDYKMVLAKSESDGEVIRLHVIRTDGRKVARIKSDSADGGVDLGNGEITITINGKTYTNANSKIIIADSVICIIDGKKCDKEALAKIKPESIASMTVYKPGSKEAVELSGRKDVAVIKVVTK